MDSRERVIAALERRHVDRIPLSLKARRGTVEKLCRHFGIEPGDGEGLLRRMRIDIRSVHPSYEGPGTTEGGAYRHSVLGESVPTEFGGSDWVPCDFAGEGGVAATYADGLGFRPLNKAATVQEVEEHTWPNIESWNFHKIKRTCRKYRKYAIMCGGWAPVLSRLFELFGMQRTFVNLMLRPDLLRVAIDKVVDYYYDLYDAALSAAEGEIDIIGFGDDFATQHDMMVNPETWRSMFKKPLARLFSLGRKHGCYVFFHACGAIRSVIPDLIETGVDILYPIQPRARGMEPAALKRDFGDDLAFWGAIDVQKTLPFGTTDDVRREVRERIKVLGAGGGYILSSSHLLLQHFPLQNILAMYDEAVRVDPPLMDNPTLKTVDRPRKEGCGRCHQQEGGSNPLPAAFRSIDPEK